MGLIGIVASVVALASIEAVAVETPGVPIAFKPAAVVDAQGRIDVWALRRDVAEVEAHLASDDTDHCWPEGDEGEEPSAAEAARAEAASRACVAATAQTYADYARYRDALNAAWLAPLRTAIEHGDAVAEVILRQCSTTPVLDRRGIESTCDDDEARQAIARTRLGRIGFVPAMDPQRDIVNWQRQPDGKRALRENQQRVLEALRHGAMAFDFIDIDAGGNVARDADDFDAFRRWAVIEAVMQDAPRAFTILPHTNSAGWKTAAFAELRLNRTPLTPGFLAWGPELYYGGSPSPWSGIDYWRSGPKIVFYGDAQVAAAGPDVAAFRRERADTLAAAEAGIDRYLQQDPRWAVFLLHRVGHHEWVPDGMRSDTGRLDASWDGEWELKREATNWLGPMHEARGHARIRRDADGNARIDVHAEQAAEPVRDVEDCALRYSGGLTYFPQVTAAGQSPQLTTLGYFYDGGGTKPGSFGADGANAAAVAPFDPRKRYRQVLVQCANAEAADNDRVRFLLLAGDVLVEFAVATPFSGKDLHVRHYERTR